MAKEIERKYLLKDSSWKPLITRSVRMTQGYFPSSGVTVRVRIAGEKAFLTVKGKSDASNMRSEFEYPVPVNDAEKMLEEFCSTRIVDKIRHYVPAGNKLVWEIDEYLGLNEGLFTAEIELPSVDTQYVIPEWIGQDVTSIAKYSNGSLSKHPYTLWRNS